MSDQELVRQVIAQADSQDANTIEDTNPEVIDQLLAELGE